MRDFFSRSRRASIARSRSAADFADPVYGERWVKWVSWGRSNRCCVLPVNPAHFSRYLDYLYHDHHASQRVIMEVCVAAGHMHALKGYDSTIGKTCYNMFLRRNGSLQRMENELTLDEAGLRINQMDIDADDKRKILAASASTPEICLVAGDDPVFLQ